MHRAVYDLLEDGTPGPELVRSLDYEFGARCPVRLVRKELDALLTTSIALSTTLGKLRDALDEAEEYGYEWPIDDPYTDEPPTIGDATWEAHLNPLVSAFVSEYRRSATFMTRVGQRSQRVSHVELDPTTGLTPAQAHRRAVLRRAQVDRRRRDAERARARRDDDSRILQLEAELCDLRRRQHQCAEGER